MGGIPMPEDDNSGIDELINRELKTRPGGDPSRWEFYLWLLIGVIGVAFAAILLFILFVIVRTIVLYGLVEATL